MCLSMSAVSGSLFGSYVVTVQLASKAKLKRRLGVTPKRQLYSFGLMVANFWACAMSLRPTYIGVLSATPSSMVAFIAVHMCRPHMQMHAVTGT